MHKLEVTPAPCLNCGAGNTPDPQTGARRLFVDLERDVNWNDPAILCEDCIAQMGSMVGMISSDARHTFQRELKNKDREIHALHTKLENMQRRARKLGFVFDEQNLTQPTPPYPSETSEARKTSKTRAAK